jgi:hypothetical protein
VEDEPQLSASERAELAALRSRVAALERERSEEIARAMAAAAAALDRAYWLDRWHVDLNARVATRTGTALRSVLRVLRVPVRAVRMLARRALR